MTVDGIEIQTKPKDLMQRLERWPRVHDQVMKATMSAAMLTAVEKVPSYPPPPPGSRYVRTGQLGRSLGVDFQSGAPIGSPGIFVLTRKGTGIYEGRVGTNLGYAAEVIGEGTQKPVHQGRWWTVKDWASRARPKIQKLFDQSMQQLADFINGLG